MHRFLSRFKMVFWKIRWSLLLLIFWQVNPNYIEASWPSSSSSNIQLLGLFQDPVNTSNPTTVSVHSRAMFQAAILLAQQYNITIAGQFLGWQAIQTGGQAISAAAGTCQVMSNSNILGIVGPAYSSETPIIADFAEQVGIPVISYSATNPTLSDRNAYPAFYRTVPSDTSAAFAIAKLFIRFNWTSCLIIYQNDAFGTGGSQVITEAFIDNKLTVSNTLIFDLATLNFQNDLKNTLTNSPSRIVVLWATPEYTELILQKAIDADVLGPQFTWILSSSIPLNSFNETFYPQLVGLLTIEPVTAGAVGASINKTLLNAAYDIWKQYEPETFPGPTEVSDYALFAFDATWMLIQSLEKLCSSTVFGDFSSCISFIDSPFCFNLRFLNSYFDIINNMTFLGVSGLVQFSINATDRINGNYYYSENSQTYSDGINFVSVLGYSDGDGWVEYGGTNPIIWPGNTTVVPTDNAKLNGTILRIGVVELVPYTFVSTVTNQFGYQKQTFTGYMPDLINLLQRRTGFIPNIELVPSNVSYNQAVQAVADGVYDILVADTTVLSARTKIAAFSSAIYFTSLVIVIRKSSPMNIDLFAFLKPFSRNLWLLIFGVLICCAVLFSLIEREDNETLKEKSIISAFGISIWYCFRILLGYAAGINPSTPAGRLLTSSLFILGLVLVSSYTANLASALTISKSSSAITGINDIKSGKIPYNRIGILLGSSFEAFYLQEISSGVKNFYPATTSEVLYNYLLNGTIDAFLTDIAAAEYTVNNMYCNLTVVGQDFDRASFGIVMPKQWLYEEDLNVNILALRESGELDKLKSKWIDKSTCSILPVLSSAMQIQSLKGLFLVFGLIVTLSLSWFTWKKWQSIKFHAVVLVS